MKTWLVGIIWIAVGILVLVLPHLINWLIGIALIVVGILTLFGKRAT